MEKNNRTVLIVEDDRGLNTLLARNLEKNGYSCIQAFTGAEALDNLSRQPQVVLLDYKLPDKTGIQVLEDLQAKGCRAAVVIMTGYSDQRLAVEMMKRGAKDYLVKDLDLTDTLPGVLERVFDNIDLQHRLAAAQADIARSAAEWSATFDVIDEAIFVLGPDLAILRANRACALLTGVPLDKIPGMKCHELLHGTKVPPQYCRTGNLPEDGSIRDHYEPALKKTLEIRVIPLKNQGQNPGSLLHVIRDITERKQTEKALRTSEEKFRNLAELLPAMLYEMNMSGTVTYVNKYAYKMTGYTPEDFNKGFLGINFIVPEDHPKVRENMQELFNGRAIGPSEYRAITKDGTTLPVLATSVPIILDGKPVGLRGIFFDITGQKRAEEERRAMESRLRQSQKMEAIGNLAGGIAHDFNNLLGGISGFAELIKMQNPPEKLAGYADKILDTSGRAAELIRQLLDFSRKSEIAFLPADMHKIIYQVQGILKHTIDRRITIRTELNAAPPVVMGDAGRLQNALLNLAVNARDAMPEGGIVSFKTEVVPGETVLAKTAAPGVAPGRYLEIEVTDTGAGMDENVKAHLFEPFFTTKEQGKGTGLGLASVFGCVKQHNGHLAVESELGKGTSFRIYLPLSAKEVKPAAHDTRYEALKGTGTILLVDDEAVIRQSVQEILSRLDYNLVCRNNGREAVEYYRPHHKSVDLVVLDMNMPEMNGLDCFRELKKINPNVAVLIASGYSDPEETRAVLKEGAKSVLRKPFRAKELAQAVREAMGNPHSSPPS
jgi:PAS domain S-box-containing protein